jgi:nucleotide-binding universal stress UspA family protein
MDKDEGVLMGTVAERSVVVGVDGSEHGWRALAWAVREAKLRRARVVVVHAFDLSIAGMEHNNGWALDAPAHKAQQVLDGGVRRARDEGVDAVGMLKYGSAAKALLRVSEGAEMLVVGSRGRGGLASALLGSVSTACAHHATCPLVIVPPPDQARQSGTDGAEAHLVG